jgi:hypothetical protein
VTEVLGLQGDDSDGEPDARGEDKQSAVSYFACRNSRTSQIFCIRP